MSQKTLFQQSTNPSFRSKINQKEKILQHVRKLNQLSNALKKPDFKTVRKPNYPKHKTKNIHSFIWQENKTSRSVKPKIATFQSLSFCFCFCDLTEAVAFNYLPNVMLSSAAAFKLQLCGNFCAAKPQSCDLKAVQGA